MKKIEKPEEGEYAPYAIMYIGLLPDDGLVLKYLEDNSEATNDFILSLPEERLTYRYGEGKWTIKDILAIEIGITRTARRTIGVPRQHSAPNSKSANY